MEVLAKGPVHEAFATTAEAPAAAPVVPKQPPEPIEELPPEQKPEGDNVQWLPGYWHWDEEGEKFIWVSGFWRQPPPGRVWVPGSWRAVTGGWHWVGGFWQEVSPKALPAQPNQPVQPEIEYLSEPPATLEVGPTVAAPSTTSMYVPGAWVWRGRYVWRPGVWVERVSGFISLGPVPEQLGRASVWSAWVPRHLLPQALRGWPAALSSFAATTAKPPP